MKQHTPEPWHIECQEFDETDVNPRMWPNIHSGEFEICGTEGFYCGDRDLDIANASRIVACVNACAGISTENLEDNKPIIELARAYNEVLRQRDELMEDRNAWKDRAEFSYRQRDILEGRASLDEVQRDELLAALENLTNVFENIGITSGIYDDEQEALKSAREAIYMAKGGAA